MRMLGRAGFVLAAMLFIGLSTPTLSGSMIEDEKDPVWQAALNNYHQELCTCYSYFKITAEGLRRSKYSDAAISYDAVADKLLKKIYLMHRPETGLARIKIANKTLTGEMFKDFANISILLAKYAEPCKVVVEDPEGRITYWFEKEESRTAR